MVSRLDIKHVFRLLHVPIHTSDINLLGKKVQGSYFFIDKRLQFDCSASCSKFEIYSLFLEWALKKSQSINALHISDDFMLACT